VRGPQLEERDLNTKEEARQLALLTARLQEEEVVGILEVVPELLLTVLLEAEQADLATLVAAFSRPLPLPQQARLVLLMAKHPRSTCSTPRTSKALR